MLGRNIRALRKQSGLTQGRLARYLGITPTLVSRIERGVFPVTSDMLDKLSALFGVPVETFHQASIQANQVLFPLAYSKLDDEGLDAVSAINRIAMNLAFMARLSEEPKTKK